ncbi:MAG: helix-hairpin-helix domain-containing protein, partial [Candidatus Hodarchaeota archaeon]
DQESEILTEQYTLSTPEAITSKLASPTAIRSHLLASIATEMTQTRSETDDLIAATFFSYQYDQWEIEHHVSSALTFLEEGGLISIHDDQSFSATPLGHRASRLYIDPYTALLFRDALSQADALSEIGVLHLICHSPDQPTTYLTRSEFEDYELFLEDYEDSLLVQPPDSWEDPEGYSNFLSQIKTARLLEAWIDERMEKDITEDYSVGMGDVHRYVHSADWLAYSASEIARVVGVTHHIPFLHNLRFRLKYGVRDELLELVRLRGIGRIRGRMLFSHGFSNISALYDAPLEKLARIPTIGTSIAASIKMQLGQEADRSAISSEPIEEEQSHSFQTLLEDFESFND